MERFCSYFVLYCGIVNFGNKLFADFLIANGKEWWNFGLLELAFYLVYSNF